MIDAAWVSGNFPGLTSVFALPQGGQKWVFSAQHAVDGAVVLKLIKPTTEVERVRREVLAVTQAGSARIPRIYEQGVIHHAALDQDLVWLREQKISGSNVRELLAQGPLNHAEVLRLGLDVLQALNDLAQARIVHRDVKPDNIIRCVDGSYWLLDFGIARHLDLLSITATAMLAGPGTLGYAPPEQYRNRKREVDARADLFALAVTMVECLTGVNPYRHLARDALEVFRRIECAPLPLPAMPWDRTGMAADLISCMAQRRVDCRPANALDALQWIQDVRTSVLAPQ